MMETYHILEEELQRHYNDENIRSWKKHYDGLPFDTSHTSHQAIVWSVFRDPTINNHMCLLAARLLQKKEVCNKAGAYSSHRQRSDVLQEYNNVVINFRMWLENTSLHSLFHQIRMLLDQPSWIFYVVDHTSVPVTLTHIHNATVHQAHTLLPSTTLHIRCPQCQHSFRPTETQEGEEREV